MKNLDIKIIHNLQKAYESIENFNGDWVKPLMDKFNLTRDEILSHIVL